MALEVLGWPHGPGGPIWPWRSYMALIGPLWLYMALIGPIWLYMDPIWLYMGHMALYGPCHDSSPLGTPHPSPPLPSPHATARHLVPPADYGDYGSQMASWTRFWTTSGGLPVLE